MFDLDQDLAAERRLILANDLRPAGWTSADAAGLPILPGWLTLLWMQRNDEI